MRKIKYIIVLFITLIPFVLIGIDSNALDINKANITENESEINIDIPDISYVSIDSLGLMKASWYGPRFHGKFTANREVYNQMAFTAAHKTLPFGTILQITNIKNKKTATVRINDRGPYIKGRDLDLSKGAAIALGAIEDGVIMVEVDKISTSQFVSPFNSVN
jgi:rare lipoprotein A